MSQNGSLVIGGTGMLASATRWLALHYPPTILVARRASIFAPGKRDIIPADLDWNDTDFLGRVAAIAPPSAQLAKVLVWVHDPARLFPGLLEILPAEKTVVMLGSGDSRHTIPLDTGHAALVRLGSKSAPGRQRRWLTNEEISEGAIAALKDGRSRTIGEIRHAD